MNQPEILLVLLAMGCVFIIIAYTKANVSKNKSDDVGRILQMLRPLRPAHEKNIELEFEIHDTRSTLHRLHNEIIGSGMWFTVGLGLFGISSALLYGHFSNNDWVVGLLSTFFVAFVLLLYSVFVYMKKVLAARRIVEQVLNPETWLEARELRARLHRKGVRISNVSFYQIMADLEKEEIVESKKVPELVGEETLAFAHYRLHPSLEL